MPNELYRFAQKSLTDGRIAWLTPMLFSWRLCIGRADDDLGYDDGWCYEDWETAKGALAAWDGSGEPQGWHRHPASGRRVPREGVGDGHGT
jgi:hypothetical protein